MPEKNPPSPNDGHRGRLREKFLRAGLPGLHDYEIIELLLTLGTPRTDCKQRAKDAVKQFGGLRGVLDASPEELEEIKGIGPRNSFGIRLVRELATRYLKEKALELPDCGSAELVRNYLYNACRVSRSRFLRSFA